MQKNTVSGSAAFVRRVARLPYPVEDYIEQEKWMPTIGHIGEKAEHITLVNAAPGHAQLLYDIFMGAGTRKYSPVGKTSVPELAERLAQGGEAFSGRAAFYRLFGEFDSVLFGTFIMKNIDWEGGEAEIGFSLLDQWQGQGLGAALVYKSVAKVFAESTMESVWATVSVTNAACIGLMRSLGFSHCDFYQRAFFINGASIPQLLYRMNRKDFR